MNLHLIALEKTTLADLAKIEESTFGCASPQAEQLVSYLKKRLEWIRRQR